MALETGITLTLSMRGTALPTHWKKTSFTRVDVTGPRLSTPRTLMTPYLEEWMGMVGIR